MGLSNRSEIVFNGISSKTVDLYIAGCPNYVIPEKDYEVTHVPGRNGDIVVDIGSYGNIQRDYSVSFGDEFEKNYIQKAAAVSSWLHSGEGYCRLEDSYEPNCYRMAYHKASTSFSNLLMQAGAGTLSFVCKPQRFLKIGETPVPVTSAGTKVTLENDTLFRSKPLILVQGEWDGSINDYDHDVIEVWDSTKMMYEIKFNPVIVLAQTWGITPSEVPSLTDKTYKFYIDADLQDVYSYDRTKNLNASVKLTYGYPELMPGVNKVQFLTGGDISSLQVTPRWWQL